MNEKSIAYDGICMGGNFLGLVGMQSKFDPFLKDLINKHKSETKYLSPDIQNEVITLLALRNKLVARIQEPTFFSVIFDTTSDISKVDQLSMIIWYVQFDHEMNVVNVCESFMGCCVVANSSALGLTMAVVNFLESIEFSLDRIRGQRYMGHLP